MKTSIKPSAIAVAKHCLFLAMVLTLPFTVPAAIIGRTFETPEGAAAALATAAIAGDADAVQSIFGAASADLENSDRVQAAYDLKAFATAVQQSHRVIHKSDSLCVLVVGNTSWPLPVPIVKKDGRWHFDTDEGREELLNRRIGRNELLAIASMRAYARAQRDYATRDRDGDEVREYAQKIRSTPGSKDGLYWPRKLDGGTSPLGPLFADASQAGYKSAGQGDSNSGPQPFHGYYFKLLTRQGSNAPGGAYNYVINGNMIGGFAMIAWPADYGEGGIMTFMINQQGRLLEKDLGQKTSAVAMETTVYNPDATWRRTQD